MTMTTVQGVRCGNKAAHGTDTVYHASPADVRSCYQGTGTGSAPDLAAFKRGEQTAATPERYQAGLDQAAKNARYATWRTIPVYGHNRGYYALPGKEQTKFFRVERPTKGRHAGRTFVKMQSSDSFDRMEWEQTGYALDKIAADPQAAALLYAQEIGRCSRCNRTLTDATSRERGMGPDCYEKWGA